MIYAIMLLINILSGWNTMHELAGPSYCVKYMREDFHYELGHLLKYMGLLVKEYRVCNYSDPSEKAIDSFMATAVAPADTNALYYIDFDSNYTYLVSAVITPGVRLDTLLSYGNKDLGNWLKNITQLNSEFICSRQYSVLTYCLDMQLPQARPQRLRIIKIEKNNKYEILQDLSNIGDWRVSMDYKLFLFCTINGDSIGGDLIVYDIEHNIMRSLKEAGANNLGASSLGMGKAIFLLKMGKGGANIWKYDPASGLHQLTNFSWPLSVTDLDLRTDGIHYYLEDHNGNSGYVEEILGYNATPIN